MGVKDFFQSIKDAEDLLDCRTADELPGRPFVVPTGSIGLDDILGCGGYPGGRITQIYGPPGGGKTFQSLIAIKNAQKIDPSAEQIFIDAEQTFNPSWAESIGIDISKVVVVDSDSAQNGRECFKLLLGSPKEDSKHVLVEKKNGLIDQIASKELNVNFIVLDSVGSIIAPIEDTSEVGKSNMSPLARFLSKEVKRLSLDVSKTQMPFMFINHVKAVMDAYSGKDHTYSGGNSYTHFLSANVYFEAIQRKDSQILDAKENKVGHAVRATVEKTKFGPWPKKCEFKVKFDEGVVDSHEELIQVAINHDVVLRPTNARYEFAGQDWIGIGKFQEAVKASQELTDQLRSAIEDVWNKRFERKPKVEEVKVSKRKKKEE